MPEVKGKSTKLQRYAKRWRDRKKAGLLGDDGKMIPYRDYLSSKQWLAKRAERIAIDSGVCTRCSSPHNLQVHHLSYRNLGVEPMSDLVTLCKPCHRARHNEKPRRKSHGWLKRGQSAAGGWSREQLELIGVSWPPQKGWRARVQRKYDWDPEITRQFVALKDAHNPPHDPLLENLERIYRVR